MGSRVPDAVQRSPGDANGPRECAPDDRLRIVQYAAPQSRDPQGDEGLGPGSAAHRYRAASGHGTK